MHHGALAQPLHSQQHVSPAQLLFDELHELFVEYLGRQLLAPEHIVPPDLLHQGDVLDFPQ